MSSERDGLRRRILQAALPSVPFDGWSAAVLERAAVACGEDALAGRRAFPGGAAELVGFFVAETDRQMLEELGRRDLAALPIRQRIATAVRVRLELAEPHREAVRRAFGLQLMPSQTARTLRGLYRTVDAMWWACGDTATDFNHYTKRALLAGVYASTLVVWLNDVSAGSEDSWAFLDRRIGDVMRIQKGRGRLDRLRGCLPSPIRLLATLRHGAARSAVRPSGAEAG